MNRSLVLQRQNFFGGVGLAIFILAMVSFSVGSAEAKGKKNTPAASQPTVIASVTPSSVTIKEQTASKTLSISSLTEITVNGQKATAADLKPGMTVSVTLRDQVTASRIVATGP